MSGADHLRRLLVARQAALQAAGAAATYPPPGFKQPRVPNVLGVFGPRGSGKSTLLLLKEDRKEAAEAGWEVLRPVDCSLAHPRHGIGLTVLHAIERHVRGIAGADACDCTAPSKPATGETRARTPAKRDFEELARGVLLSEPSASGVLRGTATSAADWAGVAGKQVADRLDLPQALGAWLTQAADAVSAARRRTRPQSACHGFVVPLDDLDLATAAQVRGLVRSLLDELHQPRLLFVLAADLDRLEDATRDRARRIDRATGEELLYKLVPERLRVYLDPWPPKKRVGFQPLAAGEGVGPGDGPAVPSAEDTLGDRLARVSPSVPSGFLPEFPRGLEDLYAGLPPGTAEGPPAQRGAPAPSPSPHEVLIRLAQARRESELARRLRTLPVLAAVHTMRWTSEPPDDRWVAAVRAAGGREAPMEVLVPDTCALPIDPYTPSAESAGWWTEVLLDEAMRPPAVGGADWLPPESLLGRVPALQLRTGRSRFGYAVDADRMRRMLDWNDAELAAALWWVEIVGYDEQAFNVSVGWRPLVRFLRGEREHVNYDLLDAAAVTPPDFQELVFEGGTLLHRVPLPLPDKLRSMVLLVDALADARWEELAALLPGASLAERARVALLVTAGAWLRAAGRAGLPLPAEGAAARCAELAGPVLPVRRLQNPGEVSALLAALREAEAAWPVAGEPDRPALAALRSSFVAFLDLPSSGVLGVPLRAP